MNNDPNAQPDSSAPSRLSPIVRILGALFFAGNLALFVRLTWEQTVWTWERGPQMVGFSLVHGPGAFLLLFYSYFGPG